MTHSDTRRPVERSPAADDPPAAAARLDDLGRLRESGVLSAAEFEAAKAKLLGG